MYPTFLYSFLVKLGEDRWLSSNKLREHFFYDILVLKQRMGTEQVESIVEAIIIY